MQTVPDSADEARRHGSPAAGRIRPRPRPAGRWLHFPRHRAYDGPDAQTRRHPNEALLIEDPDRLTIQTLREMTGPPGGATLEIGCGDGRLSAGLSGGARRYVAVDPDRSAIVTARARVANAGFCAASGEALPFGADSFDRVLFTLSLHHQDSRRALAEARRVLRPGGRIVAVEPLDDGEVERLCNIFHDEGADLAAAVKAVAESGLVREAETVIEPPWVFEDRRDVLRWLFDYYDRGSDAALERRVDAFLGERRTARPIVLMDRLVAFRLREPDDSFESSVPPGGAVPGGPSGQPPRPQRREGP